MKNYMNRDKVDKVEKNNWFKCKGYSAVLNITVTSHSILKTQIIRRLREAGMEGEFKVSVR